MERLRGPEGCPWDREQSWRSLRRYLLEETYEVAEAIDSDDPDALREELGDLLLQIVFLAQIAAEQGHFTVDAVARGIADKLVRRHPHVFGSASASTAAEVVKNWEEIKRQERGEAGPGPAASRLTGIPKALPPLAKAVLLGERASQCGFDWSGVEGVLDKLDEELAEVREAHRDGNRDALTEEIGDLLFSVVNLARKGGVDADAALEATNQKFRRRFAHIECKLAAEGIAVEQAGPDKLERLWQEAKAAD